MYVKGENQKNESFESSLKALEKVVTELESGEASLETQLESFERGVQLSRECLARLEAIENRVEKLVQSGDGSLKTAPFDNPTVQD